MRVQLLWASVAIALALVAIPATHAQNASRGVEAANAYEAFLSSWRGKDKAPLNVAEAAEPLSAQDLKEISSCAGGSGVWQAAEANAPLRDQLSALPWVHLVEPGKWRPTDPGDLIARGKPVGKAVDLGFSHALLTLSKVAFERSGQRAALRYSFVCGRLCGNGGTVLLERSPQGWVRSKTQCGTWMSHSGRPNNSSKPTPLRGAA